MADPRLREMIEARQFFVAPGIQDMITAVVAEKVGFTAVYGSGYWMTASAYGLPDAGIVSFTQMLDRMATLVKTTGSAVIADADTGFGGLLNVHHTVRGYEDAGVSAIQIEDQEFPKKCGHTPFKRLVPVEDMVEKVKVAVAARRDPNFLIIARTDARQSEGLEGSIARAQAYAAAGADIMFCEALTSEEEMKLACAAVPGPMMANMANGGLTPVLNAKTLAAAGYAFAIYPSLTSLVAASAMERALHRLKDDGDGQPDDLGVFDFKEFCGMIGFQEVWDFEKKWAK